MQEKNKNFLIFLKQSIPVVVIKQKKRYTVMYVKDKISILYKVEMECLL